ncbi:uncharacterized protein LOC129600377 [Paramacrobiotus metropolitanus]|uniref:uncharacterized protein LOC129600377 n=1 Tax=Paramacrobiotus metropolitanus TaxID=2943436 RepID=UPI0024458B20|nr:uncharacterized protein LOC129600377 [Paramacrobiotus metropolitanus]XP_055354845.1 uncharacterized protein LOC129600377 [Paramacrobiotus metropolitanus]
MQQKMHLLEKILWALLSLLSPEPGNVQTCTVSKAPAHRSGPRTLFDDIVDDGIGTRRADVIQLQFPNSLVPKLGSAEADWKIRRPRLGAEITMTCEVPDGAALSFISWTHQGALVYDQGRAIPIRAGGPDRGKYNFSQTSIVVLFRIAHVTIHSSGEVTCLLLKDPVHEQYDVLRRYKILPRLTSARDLFVNKMADVWTNVGDNVIFNCSVSVTLPRYMILNYRNKWIWRHNGRVIMAPSGEPYATLLGPHWRHGTMTNVAFDGTDETLDETVNFRMPFHQLTPQDSGPVECWFRLYPDIHEWIRQTVYLNVMSPK